MILSSHQFANRERQGDTFVLTVMAVNERKILGRGIMFLAMRIQHDIACIMHAVPDRSGGSIITAKPVSDCRRQRALAMTAALMACVESISRSSWRFVFSRLKPDD